MNDLQQFKDTYITECFELLEEMEEKLLQLDAANADMEELNAIFRCAHSIKGGAGAFGFTNIANFTHILEALLDKMREGTIDATAEVVDTLLRARDIVFQMVVAAQEGSALPDDYGQDVAVELDSFNPQAEGRTISSSPAQAAASATGAAEPATYRISFVPQSGMIANGNEPLLLLRELADLGELSVTCHSDRIPDLVALDFEGSYLHWEMTLSGTMSEEDIREVFEFVEDECELTILKQQESPSAAAAAADKAPPSAESASPAQADNAAAAPKKAAPAATSIRVDIDKVDDLINMVGEVVITQAFLSAQARQLSPQLHSELIRGVDEMMHHTRELQEAVMAVRMQPVKSIFSRMPRMVRDLSNQLGKEIELEMHGENTEVDKTIIEQLSDPLTHMIRNSVDHGIESPQKREAAGKPRKGTIHLSAEHRGGRIVIEIADDGGGINREKVYEKAVEKGVIEAGANLAPGDIDMLIFAAGFSTAEVVSNVSGRGVGMDVVRRNIEGLGGSVQVENRPGEGSVFSISLPLTLAILDGMIVRCGQEYYIVPINSIIETLRPKSGDVKAVADGNHVINVRGQFLPIVYLYKAFNIPDAVRDPSQGLVVLVENGSKQLGLVVDELVGQQQVVIKSLEENSDPIEGISGATILGDGKVSLILDVGKLHKLNQNGRTPPPTSPHPEASDEENDFLVAPSSNAA